MKRVCLQPLWKVRTDHQWLMANPPPGYEFFTRQGIEASAIKLTGRVDLIRIFWYRLAKAGVPLHLMKAYLDKFRPPPAGTELTWAVARLVFRREPWVLDLLTELPAVLVGTEWHFERWKSITRRCLLSPYCRKIVCGTQANREALVKSLDNEALEQKTRVVYTAVPGKEFTKSHSDNSRCRLLFVNSANLSGEFELKGGKEALETFVALRQRYPDLEMVVRSDVPRNIERRYGGAPGLRFIQEMLPWESLEKEFQAADIFFLPTHITPYAVFLDAMSYELPVVTTDVWCNRELVDDGRTGLLVPKSSLASEFLPEAPWARTREFAKKVVKQVDPKMVGALVTKLSFLIENPESRRQMGRAGRREVEEGRFSMARRNEALKRVLDEATGEKPAERA
jgi:glycosyltransferase involved in cell wall biosynthesis